MVFVANATAEIDEQSQYKSIIAVCGIMSCLSGVIVSSRFYVRTRSSHIATDDWMSMLSLLFAIAYSVLCSVQTKYGLGLPLSLRPKQNLILYTRVNYAGRPVYQVGISFFKIALLISYLRLLRGTSNTLYRLVVWATVVFVFFGHLSSALLLLFACRPLDKSWNPLKPGTCLPIGASFTAYAVLTIVSDVIVTILPIPVLCTLNIRREKKMGLIGAFALGLFTTLCSILRYRQINRIQFGDGNSTLLVLWGVIEFHVGTIVSSLPFLAPICLRKAREYRSRQSRYGKGSWRGGESHGGIKDGDDCVGQGNFAEAAVSSANTKDVQKRGSIMVQYEISVESHKKELNN